ncbi:TetR/AcrR family transcriptional regulator [Amycolatopsis suaedae]|uniref:TetR family transcriptional regulator n=1 Tax=Amycolatopsis suaedae TaxID=2510978 RepID=A0A4Q7JDA9_9PSEU|nr:TetR family transcriptional regulator [Amycolatopsis suaedae]RZQ65327.1 TetR family transcriptional regulator [Amycolatopsis suaedae]
MARLSRAESRARTRERLLTAAAELFTERGVNGTSVEQIAERAGFSRGAFYGNFADKQELVRELLLERTRAEESEVRAMGASFAAASEELRAWNRERAEHLPQWLALRLELVLHALREPDSRPLAAERDRRAQAAIADGVRANTPGADADFLALLIHALEDGLLIQHLLDPERVPADVVVDAVSYLLGTARG